MLEDLEVLEKPQKQIDNFQQNLQKRHAFQRQQVAMTERWKELNLLNNTLLPGKLEY